VRLDRADFIDDPAWVQITSWQADGLTADGAIGAEEVPAEDSRCAGRREPGLAALADAPGDRPRIATGQA
jgi:hypothetical protein